MSQSKKLSPSKMLKSPTGALRDRKGKFPFSWIPYEILEAIASVLYKSSEEGGGKYPKHNWKKCAEHSVPMDSLLRHSFKRCRGEMTDEESKLPHSWHMLVNAAFLVYYEQYAPELNDLEKPPKLKPGVKNENQTSYDKQANSNRKSKRKFSPTPKGAKRSRGKKGSI